MEKSTLKDMKFGKEKLQNIWYFYKWHILIALFFTVAGIWLVTHCAADKEADIYIYFAGPVYFTANAQEQISDAFSAVIPDEYGETVSMITTVYGKDVTVGSTEEEDQQYYINYTEKQATLAEFKNQMRLPNTVICLLSPTCFKIAVEDGQTLRPLREVLDDLPEGVTEDGYGIKLSSLPFYSSNSVLKQFPEDTVLCVKNASDFRNKDRYENTLKAFRTLCAFGKQE